MFRRVKILIKILRSTRRLHHALTWTAMDWSMPALQEIKWSVLKRYSAGIDVWIETGTFLGDTTEMLSKISPKVFSIEPSEHLFRLARERFIDNERVNLLLGTSEDRLYEVLMGAQGRVALWFDGHYSGGITFEGTQVSPILYELQVVHEHLLAGGSGVVFVDDVRLFEGAESGYPVRSELVSWADRNQAWWTIEHDIFITRYGLSDLAVTERVFAE